MAEPRGWTNRGQSAELAVLLVEGEQRIKIDRREAIAPGEEEALVADDLLQPLDPAAGVGVQPGVDQFELPAIHRPLAELVPELGVVLDLPARIVDAQLSRRKRSKVGRVTANVVTFVTERDHEVPVTEARVVPHDVPEDWDTAYFNHWFW